MTTSVSIVRQYVALIQTYAIVAEDGDPVKDRVERAIASACTHFCTAASEVPDELLADFRKELEVTLRALHPTRSRSKEVFELALSLLPRTI